MQVAYGFLGYRGVEQRNVTCMIEFLGHCSARGVPALVVPHGNDALVGRARGILARKFMETDGDVLLCVDSDIVFRPDDAWRVCEAAMEKDIVAGLYVTRTRKGGITTSRLFPNTSYDFSQVTLHEIKWAGGGFVAIHRRVFETLKRHKQIELVHQGTDLEHWTYYRTFAVDEEPDGRIELGEDWAVCERAREMGYRVWLDTGVRLGHLGMHEYTLEDLLAVPRQRVLALRQASDNTLKVSVAEQLQEVA